MTHYHQPGWSLPNGHVVRTRMEASLCDYLTGAKEPHAHGAQSGLAFEVTVAPQRHALYVPSIVLTESRHESRLIVIEPIDSLQPGGGVRRLQGFRKGHWPQYFVIVVARRALLSHLPEDSFDFSVPLEDYQPLDTFLIGL